MSNSFSRRSFLQAAGSASAFGLAGCAGFPAITSSRSPNGKLRHLCIGCGSQGRSNIAKLATHKRIEMAAFCDVDMLMLDIAQISAITAIATSTNVKIFFIFSPF